MSGGSGGHRHPALPPSVGEEPSGPASAGEGGEHHAGKRDSLSRRSASSKRWATAEAQERSSMVREQERGRHAVAAAASRSSGGKQQRRAAAADGRRRTRWSVLTGTAGRGARRAPRPCAAVGPQNQHTSSRNTKHRLCLMSAKDRRGVYCFIRFNKLSSGGSQNIGWCVGRRAPEGRMAHPATRSADSRGILRTSASPAGPARTQKPR